MTGFTEGYNTMDALSFLSIWYYRHQAIRSMGVTSTKGILVATAKSGGIAILFLGVIYAGIAYLGATSVNYLDYLTMGDLY